MHVRELVIRNIRSIELLKIQFASDELAGWHVLLGANGAGKSSVIRALALALVGPDEAMALRQEWGSWLRHGAKRGSIELDTVAHRGLDRRQASRTPDSLPARVELRLTSSAQGGAVTISGNPIEDMPPRVGRGVGGLGWFSASFGPFRRFSGGDPALDRLFEVSPYLSAHLTAFGEDVALVEALRWLRGLRVGQLEQDGDSALLLERLVAFLNKSELLPNGAQVVEVTSSAVVLQDANGARVAAEQMSDGFRSMLSMIFEILRQMTRAYGVQRVVSALEQAGTSVDLPGVVAIDEVDAHLHPSWQRDIGPWFTRCFPQVQFIVTTHSPIICRSATTIWRLPDPGSGEEARRIEGTVLERLRHGSILDAYGTEAFGRDVARSADSQALLAEMAKLNRVALRGKLDAAQRARLQSLRAMLPTTAADLAGEAAAE